MWIIWAIIVGLVAGALARLVVPGDQGMGLGATIVLGLAGSFVGGFLGWLLFHNDASSGAVQLSGLFGSFVGSVIVLLLWRASSGRRAAH